MITQIIGMNWYPEVTDRQITIFYGLNAYETETL